ncbi:MAG: hypothetical protein QOK17_469 [Sphingomonadales bacterium]|jgi:bacteriocin biosynthesis cyclodehydratase domain-containing protein|nr:hypothetical protein [Sphingomonadales bacterium]
MGTGTVEERLRSEAGPRPFRPWLRPGAEVIEVHEDRLHIAFANHTVTFNSPVTVRCVKALLARLGEGLDVTHLVSAAAAETEVGEGFARYVLEMLAGAHCLYWSDEDAADGPLDAYWASVGESPGRVASLLGTGRPLVLTTSRSASILEEALTAAGIPGRITAFAPGDAIESIAAAAEAMAETPSLVLAWDLPYRSVAACTVNDLAMTGKAVLFGACEGGVARLGPYVIPGSTACLACLNSRFLSNSAPEEMDLATACRARAGRRLGEPAPTHPVFLSSMAGLFVLEAGDILMRRPPRTLGGLIEYGLADGSCCRRTILKAPRCAACRAARPPRFAWNAGFLSPDVKDAAHDA